MFTRLVIKRQIGHFKISTFKGLYARCLALRSFTTDHQEYHPKDKGLFYIDTFNEHFKQRLPFTDFLFYRKLFDAIVDAEGLTNTQQGFYILEQFIIYNIHILLETESNRRFFCQMISKFSSRKYLSVKMWYVVENSIIVKMQDIETSYLVRLALYFAMNDQGSLHFYRKIADEVLDRKISTLNEQEFICLFNSMRMIKFKDELFWAIMKAANKELFPDSDEFLIN